MTVDEIAVWVSLAGLVYIYVGYPALLWLLSTFQKSKSTPDAWLGSISVVIVGYNEGKRLPAKLESLLDSDCADRIIEILVGSDGSNDNTMQILSSYPDKRLRLIHFEQRRGKAAVLNDLVPQATGEIVVLTDARQRIDRHAISRLTSGFGDPRNGVISGELCFRASDDPSAAAVGMGAYWQYEKAIRKAESRFRGVPGATGAFYAIRRDRFQPIPENTLLDDVVIPMQIVEQGLRCRFQEGAIAWDTPSQSTGQESIRKRRTIAGCLQLILNQPRWLFPWKNPLWWEFVSHKLARLLSPAFLLILLVGCLRLWDRPLYQTLLALQGGFYAAAGLAYLSQRQGRQLKVLGPILMFVSLNLTTLLAISDAVRGRFRPAWQRSE